jgi:hypothetical protein
MLHLVGTFAFKPVKKFLYRLSDEARNGDPKLPGLERG